MRSNTCGKRRVRQEMGKASDGQKKVMGKGKQQARESNGQGKAMGKGKQQARESSNTCGKRWVRQATGKERDG